MFGIDLTLRWFSLFFCAAHPTILSINNPSAFEGSDSTLFCNVSGFSTTVSWKNVRSKEERRARNWIFRNITRFDSGNYTCYANNTCDSVSKSIYVNVKCKLCLYHIDVVTSVVIFHLRFKSKIILLKKCDTLFSLYSTDLVKNMHLVTYILLTSWLFSLSGKCSLIFPSSLFLNFSSKLPPLGSHLKEPSSIVWLFWRSFLQRWFFFVLFVLYLQLSGIGGKVKSM